MYPLSSFLPFQDMTGCGLFVSSHAQPCEARARIGTRLRGGSIWLGCLTCL